MLLDSVVDFVTSW